MFTDSHCHINSQEFDCDRDEVLLRARAAGVGCILDVSDDIAKTSQIIEFCCKHENVYTTVGVHPEIADKYAALDVKDILHHTESPYVVGIGECGLDYFYNAEIKKQQLYVFEKHIEAAQQSGLPLIVHSRDADDDMIKLLAKKYKEQAFCGELHCFSASGRLCDFALEIGFYISASGIITFKKSENLRQIFATVPEDRLLIETDAPFLAPTPYRGKRNEPAYVVNTAEVLAKLRQKSTTEIAEITSNNFYTLFHKINR